ncbi:peptidoglycan-binding protein [Starkeya sp. 3C]|uniref:Peptidoglycan-binding protein n=1 Tax=Ancylobacter moscoviensis TaxID=2597768 RepID=A0ABY3DRN1_9HYPH|nr:peptidoglycan-binding domain-containing protein [Ancylobacter moscoviensis]TSJ62258.1 peptidoglycan-binding protein [Ancylobacter moscoviensis]
MPRSYASDLLVDEIDLGSERVAIPSFRAGWRRSDLFMMVLAAAASTAILFNALGLQQGRSGTMPRQAAAPTPTAAPADIRQVNGSGGAAPQAATSAPQAAPAASAPAQPETPPASLAVAPLPPIKPAPPAPRPAAVAAAPAALPAPAPVANASPAGLVPPGEVPVSPRIMDVQKALARLGYGPIRIDGKLGTTTEEAIQRFERDRRLPVTGQLSDRVIRELNAVAGLSIQ